MKRDFHFLLCAALLVAGALPLSAWSGVGHKTIVAVAQRHLTPKAQHAIAQYMPYDIKQDASWMDKHRKGAWKFTNGWHVFCVDEQHNYDPVNPGGDAISAIRNACWRLSDRREMSDSAVIFNIRTLIHCIGDMHCPVHVLIPGHKGEHHSTYFKKAYFPTVGVLVPVRIKGREEKSYHAFFDGLPYYIHGQSTDADAIAEEIDRYKKKDIRKIVAGDMLEIGGRKDFGGALLRWAKECADMATDIWRYNPVLVSDLNSDTEELAAPLVNDYMVRAGYRLARLLNAVFDNGR